MSRGTLFPNDASQVFTPILNVGFLEGLEISLMRSVNVEDIRLSNFDERSYWRKSRLTLECLGGEKDDLVRGDAHHVPVLLQDILMAHGYLPESLDKNL
jgi:hypothetical protein